MIILNADSGDEVLRADTDPDNLAASANVAYNRGIIIFTGPHAQGEIWLVSDTAATAVYYTEVF